MPSNKKDVDFDEEWHMYHDCSIRPVGPYTKVNTTLVHCSNIDDICGEEILRWIYQADTVKGQSTAKSSRFIFDLEGLLWGPSLIF